MSLGRRILLLHDAPTKPSMLLSHNDHHLLDADEAFYFYL
jgi:hypothetical protein